MKKVLKKSPEKTAKKPAPKLSLAKITKAGNNLKEGISKFQEFKTKFIKRSEVVLVRAASVSAAAALLNPNVKKKLSPKNLEALTIVSQLANSFGKKVKKSSKAD